ncbi:MAG: hypothetical protein LBK61_05110 [Spirochaetaceae bacterium]|jgi:hypothetical protein|nr:hypothetical protein [Spirochaetaceae bacterium]
MEKKFFTGMAVLLLGASLFFLGCGGDDDGSDGSEPSGNAALGTDAVVKGVAVVFGDGTGDAFATPVQGTVAAVKSALESTGTTPATTFTAADSGSSKVVRVTAAVAAATGEDAYSEPDFNAATAYANEALAAGDVLFVKVTSESGSNAKWYKITVLEDVKSTYSLKTTEGDEAVADTASGLTILSATKDAAGVTIKLGGDLAESFVYTAAGSVEYPTTDPAVDFPGRAFWMGATLSTTPVAGKYSNVYIQGFFSGLAANHNKFIAIKQTNQALRFFSGTSGNSAYVTTPLDGPKVDDQSGANYIPADTSIPPVRWRLYPGTDSTDYKKKKPDEIWGFLIYDGTLTPKTAVFEITERQGFTNDALEATANDRYTATITVDYSAVNFGNTEAVANAYSLKVSDAADANDDTDSGLEILSASKDTAGVVTIKLGGTLAAAYLYTIAANHAGTEGDSWNDVPWTDSGSDAVAGKYAAVYINGFLPGAQAPTNIAVQTRPYPALGYYKGGTFPTSALSGPTTGSANMYLDPSGDNHQKWKLFTTQLVANETFGVLLFSGGSKIVTIDFDQYNGNTDQATKSDDIITVNIDYSAVNFGS